MWKMRFCVKKINHQSGSIIFSRQTNPLPAVFCLAWINEPPSNVFNVARIDLTTCTMISLARFICLGVVGYTRAECDETCAAAAAVSGRILLQQKESIQPMKTVEPETLEEPMSSRMILTYHKTLKTKTHRIIDFFKSLIFFSLRLIFANSLHLISEGYLDRYHFIHLFSYLDLPKGAKRLLKGVNSPSLRV